MISSSTIETAHDAKTRGVNTPPGGSSIVHSREQQHSQLEQHSQQQQQQQQRKPSQHAGPYHRRQMSPTAAPSSSASAASSAMAPSEGQLSMSLPQYSQQQQHQQHPQLSQHTQEKHQHQHHQQQQPLPLSPQAGEGALPAITPWALGSTDSSYAIKLALLEKSKQLDALKERRLSPNRNQSLDAEAEAADSPTSARMLDAAETEIEDASDMKLIALRSNQSLLQDRLFQQPSAAVEATLAAACEVMSFDIAEMWLRTGVKTHQLTNSHLRPTALDESTRMDLVDVYYGEKSAERTHRLSPALCKRAKEANDVVWLSAAESERDAEALRCSISNVRTAAAVPICHAASNTNITIIFFSVRRVVVRPSSVEFLVHMALAAGVASAHAMEENSFNDDSKQRRNEVCWNDHPSSISRSEPGFGDHSPPHLAHHRTNKVSITGAPLDLQWRQLQNVEYLTDGGSSWIHTAVLQGRPVVVKTLKPECQDIAVAINEIESELVVHSQLDHGNIVRFLGAGTTSMNVRFLILERLDGGTLAQMLGYDSRIRDRRRRFWNRKIFSFVEMLRIARSIAKAMLYCHEEAIPGSVVLHRDLKPENIGFTLDGTVKVLDFGLAKIVENASVNLTDVYSMSGETGSLRYMAPEVAEGTPYNAAVDVYSFGILLWELNAGTKPFLGLTRGAFFEQVVHGGERPPIRNNKWPEPLCNLMRECWDASMWNRPTFRQVLERLDSLLDKEMRGSGGGGSTTSSSSGDGGGCGGSSGGGKSSPPRQQPSSGSASTSSSSGGGGNNNSNKTPLMGRLSGMMDRHRNGEKYWNVYN